MIGLADIKFALKKILSDKIKRWLNIQIPITGACPTMIYTAMELAQYDYENPKKEKIPFVILEMNKPYPKNDTSHPLYLSVMEEPVFHLRILEKELLTKDDINNASKKSDKRIRRLEKMMKKVYEELGMSDELYTELCLELSNKEGSEL